MLNLMRFDVEGEGDESYEHFNGEKVSGRMVL